ncbi:MAG: hypothetical protein IJ184_02840 [Alphaproteobacteria bacterium]|nr:hypothetical protein [Alphaproteobacteria bacterium]
MVVSFTRKVGSVAAGSVQPRNSRSQLVENVDTNNNVLVRDDTAGGGGEDGSANSKQQSRGRFMSEGGLATSFDALTMSGIIESQDDITAPSNQKIDVYNNNQTIVRDEDVERIGRSYLKHFYEKNEPITDIDELV